MIEKYDRETEMLEFANSWVDGEIKSLPSSHEADSALYVFLLGFPALDPLKVSCHHSYHMLSARWITLRDRTRPNAAVGV